MDVKEMLAASGGQSRAPKHGRSACGL